MKGGLFLTNLKLKTETLHKTLCKNEFGELKGVKVLLEGPSPHMTYAYKPISSYYSFRL